MTSKAKIKEAIAKLDHNSDEDWTADGLPRVTRVSELLGETITREQLDDVGDSVRRNQPDGDEPVDDANAPGQAGAARNADGTLQDEREKVTPTEGAGVGNANQGFMGQNDQDAAGVVDLDQNPNAPKIRAQTEPSGGTLVKLGDEIVVFTPNPINGQTRNEATITRLNNDGTVNAAIKKGDGTVQEMSSVKNGHPQPGDISAYFYLSAK